MQLEEQQVFEVFEAHTQVTSTTYGACVYTDMDRFSLLKLVTTGTSESLCISRPVIKLPA
jgi:hypothetical protein